MKTAKARQDFARQSAAAIRSAQSAKTSALAANAADAQRLESLAAEISEAEHRLDPEDLNAVQLLAAKREQHSRLEKKFAADSAARLADADKQLDAALDARELSDIFVAEHVAIVETVADILGPFVTERARALQLARDTDSARSAWRLVHFCVNNPFRQPLPAADILARLDSIAEGKH